MTATVTLTWPISTYPNPNRDRRKHWAKKATEAANIRASAKMATLQTMFTKAPITGRVQLTLTYAFPDKRTRDLLNFDTKAFLDGVVEAGLIEDDSHEIMRPIVIDLDPEKSPKGHLTVTATFEEVE